MLAAVALVLPAQIWTAGQAAAGHLGCGAVITADTVLDSDIGPCSRTAIVVQADNVVLDLNGHTVFGTPNPGELMGILLSNRTGVTVRNGTVTGFDGGVTLSGGGRNVLSKMTIRDNDAQRPSLGSGIAVISSSDNLIEKNTVIDNAPFSGISLDRGSRRNVVTKNEVARNARDGIFAEQASSENVVERNDVHDNGRDGIHLSGPRLTLAFENLGPTLFDLVSPDRAPYEFGSDFRVMFGSGSGDVTAAVRAVDISTSGGETNTLPVDSSTSGCEAADFLAAGFVTGQIALVQRGRCSFQTKVDNAVAAGASAVIIFNEGQPLRTAASFGTLTSPAPVPVLSASYAIGRTVSADLLVGAVIAHVVTNTLSEIVIAFPGATGYRLEKNVGHGNAVFDGFDGTVHVPCDSNTWVKNDFSTVNQNCVVRY